MRRRQVKVPISIPARRCVFIRHSEFPPCHPPTSYSLPSVDGFLSPADRFPCRIGPAPPAPRLPANSPPARRHHDITHRPADRSCEPRDASAATPFLPAPGLPPAPFPAVTSPARTSKHASTVAIIPLSPLTSHPHPRVGK